MVKYHAAPVQKLNKEVLDKFLEKLEEKSENSENFLEKYSCPVTELENSLKKVQWWRHNAVLSSQSLPPHTEEAEQYR